MTIDKIRTSDGQEHSVNYNALENRPIAVPAEYQFEQNDSLAAGDVFELDLTQYLPNDDRNYLVSIEVLGAVPANTNFNMYGYSEFNSSQYFYNFWRSSNNSSKTDYRGGMAVVLVGPSHKFYLKPSGTGTASGVLARCSWYMRAS